MAEILTAADFAGFKSLKQGGFSNKDQDAILAKIQLQSQEAWL